MGEKKTFCYAPLTPKKIPISMIIVDKSNWQVKKDLYWQDCFFTWLEADWAQEQFAVTVVVLGKEGTHIHFRSLVYLLVSLFAWWILASSPPPHQENLFLNKVSEIITLMERLKIWKSLNCNNNFHELSITLFMFAFLFKCWCIFKISLLFRFKVELHCKVNEI